LSQRETDNIKQLITLALLCLDQIKTSTLNQG
jgi:hypothetical protein